ncbi:hypothetical protein NQ318_019282 [Aromia moschata]|uniref:Uncharacterized protein n=1 Tax=Aromia moschata TaxID=1265417 RepID=A0AAV8YZC8_9CUCU|nr:hypothetical protein NQ318_019282 [Aromia moschata]
MPKQLNYIFNDFRSVYAVEFTLVNEIRTYISGRAALKIPGSGGDCGPGALGRNNFHNSDLEQNGYIFLITSDSGPSRFSNDAKKMMDRELGALVIRLPASRNRVGLRALERALSTMGRPGGGGDGGDGDSKPFKGIIDEQKRMDCVALINKVKFGVLEKYSFLHVISEEVTIDDCGLYDIEIEAFENSTIYRLNITKNPLEELKNGVFVNVYLHEVFLLENKIREVEPGSLHDIHPFEGRRVESLSLGSNRMEGIRAGVFNGTKFSRLFFNWNKIEYVESGAFDDMHQLLQIDLSHNLLQRIEVGVFQNLATPASSVWLDFGRNRIRRIHRRAFENTSVLTLNLEDNDLGFITKNYFKGTSINVLDI